MGSWQIGWTSAGVITTALAFWLSSPLIFILSGVVVALAAVELVVWVGSLEFKATIFQRIRHRLHDDGWVWWPDWDNDCAYCTKCGYSLPGKAAEAGLIYGEPGRMNELADP